MFPATKLAVQVLPSGEMADTAEPETGWKPVGTPIRTEPRAMVLEAVHGGSSGDPPPQFVTVIVNEPPSPPDNEAMNCFTDAGFAPLTLGAATRAVISSKAVARRASLPRLESNGLSADMSCPFFPAGQTTRMTLLPAHAGTEASNGRDFTELPL